MQKTTLIVRIKTTHEITDALTDHLIGLHNVVIEKVVADNEGPAVLQTFLEQDRTSIEEDVEQVNLEHTVGDTQ